MMVPIIAVKAAAEFPAVTTMLAGTAIREDVELKVTVVFAGAGPDSVARHVLVAPDIKPLGLQVSEVRSSEDAAVRGTVTDWDEPL